jgi:hypothetical protein
MGLDKERVRARNAAYYLSHGAKVRKQQRAYYWRNREALKQSAKRYNRGSGKHVRRDRELRKNGWTLAEYEMETRKQRGRCAICRRKPKRKLHGDHNHKTNKRRALLCEACNPALGAFGDSIRVIKQAIKYLQKFK